MALKTCKNGHKYDEKLGKCPHCPSNYKDPEATVISGPAMDSGKTRVVPNSASSSQHDKTRVASPKANASAPASRTRISTPGLPDQQLGVQAKLIGWLVTFSWNPFGDDFRIREGKTRIGSNPESDIRIEDAKISSDHATLLYRNGKLKIRDSFSTNGTFVNEEDTGDEPVTLSDGDTIKMGNTEFLLRLIQEETKS